MVMSWIWTIILVFSLISSLVLGNGSALAAAVPKGAQAGLELALALAGSICLWSGVGRLMEKAGLIDRLGQLLQPIFRRLFPEASHNHTTLGYLTANVSANLLGLGNAATPMGIQAAKLLKQGETATDELCRLVVLNTASIQLIPANVAAVRSALGCSTPFDLLPAVWVTSLCSAGIGITAAWLLGRVWKP